ncbi:MAG: diacylglycerol/lipid kinase family protein [Gemmatimonadales bacterium]
MARVLLITSPVAARTSESAGDRVALALARTGWRVDRADTARVEDARRFAAEGVASGVDAVAVFGGDGTTMQAAASLVGTGVPLGLIPGGTGNLLAGNLRIPTSLIAAAKAVTHGKPRQIDIGRVDLSDGAHYFGVACGAGVDARVMGETQTADKRRWGIGAYIATTLRILPQLKSVDCRITVDGHSLEAPAVVILILNCAEIIPRLIRVRPEIRIDDGVLDLLVIAADSPAQAVRSLLRVLRNSVGSRRETSYLRYARGREFRIETAATLPVQFDGDPVGATPFCAKVLPGALTVMVPGS